MKNQILFISFVFLLFSCTKEKKLSQNKFAQRNLAQGVSGVEFPSGLSNAEKANFWHYSEGSEIFPTLWMFHLDSVNEFFKGTSLLEKLDEKYGIISDPYAIEYGHPLPWVGLTASWSQYGVENQEEVLLKKGMSSFKELPIKKQSSVTNEQMISMTGINCTFCHTGSINYKDQNGKVFHQIIEGAPSQADIRSFFKDLVGSLIKTMLRKKKLEKFFESLGVKNSKEEASNFVNAFKKDLGIDGPLNNLTSSVIDLFSKGIIFGNIVKDLKIKKARQLIYEKRDVLEKNFIKLLAMTFKFESVDKVPKVLKLRMKYLALLGSPDPELGETIAGFGRTDAFGRISNLAARFKDPIPQTAPVSFPPMYAVKYKSMFHYNANTNSVVSRNIGQAFGSGAIILYKNESEKKNLHTVINFNNLMKMEELMYKIEVPELQKLFPSVKVSKVKALKGCKLYKSKCMGCHEASKERVGPTQQLIDYKVIDAKKINTDPVYLQNIGKDVDGKPFKDVLLNFTDTVLETYKVRHQLNDQTIADWSREEFRGTPIFRGTIDGENRFKGTTADYADIEPGKGYQAKSLAGVWATAPYLHNGSVQSIYQLLLPSKKRKKMFLNASNFYDFTKMGYKEETKYSNIKDIDIIPGVDIIPTHLERICEKSPNECFDTTQLGNSNKGHEPTIYGGELKEEEKYQLIEFLKVLRPEKEYSWKSQAIYDIETDDCNTH